MARIHFWSFIVNEEGQPIENASVSIYLAGTTTEAVIYNDEFSSSSTSTTPQVTTTTNGYFEFWIPDSESTNGYDSDQKFKLVWEKTGIASGYIDYIDIFSTSLSVDESDTSTIKDKSVSNYLANLWETHRLDTDHIVHGIEEIDENNTTLVKNKLISDNLAFNWDKHKSLTFSTTSVSGDTTVTGTSASSGDYPHGIKPLNFSDSLLSTDEEYWKMNRVISYHYAKKWNDYVDSISLEPIDGNSTDTELNKLMSNNILKNLYDLIGSSYSKLITPSGLYTVAQTDDGYNTTFTGNVSASEFYGNGSNITNVAASGVNSDITSTTALTQITRTTGGTFDIDIGNAAGDDFTVNTNKLVVEGDTGNVGIGTGSPTTELEVNGDITGNLLGNKNAIINGNFDIWQRGTSFSTGFNGFTTYTADRWKGYQGADKITISQQTASLNGAKYSARVQRDVGETSVNIVYLLNVLESVDSMKFRGKYVTFSFWAKKGANFSGASDVLTAALLSSTGTDEDTLSAFTGPATSAASEVTLTSSWQKFTVTTSSVLADTVNQLNVRFYYTPVGTAGADDWFEIAKVQLEEGSVATDFEYRDYGTELAMCQRYYETTDLMSSDLSTTAFGGDVTDTNIYRVGFGFKVPKRISPTMTYAIGAVSGFPATIPTGGGVDIDGAMVYHTANSTVAGGYYFFTYTASAEL